MILTIICLILDELVKSQISTLFVIPAKAGIQFVFNEKAKPFCITPALSLRAKQSQNTLISHEIAASRHALLAAKGSLAARNDQNWAKGGLMQQSQTIKLLCCEGKIS